MFVGHFAVALVGKRIEPRIPLGTLVAAAFALDLIWPLFLLAGIERVRIDPGNTAFTPLAFEHYPWSHSLFMAALWARVATVAVRQTAAPPRAGLLVGAIVLSHWLLDLLTHRADLPVLPNDQVLFGFGLWRSIPATIFVEGTFLATALYLYIGSSRATSLVGRWGLGGMVALMVAIWISGPFVPPPPSATAVAIGAMGIWLFVWAARGVDRSRDWVRD
jgi:membrane-bound metal-dependent hydrolase YbcI (DUF457 family)